MGGRGRGLPVAVGRSSASRSPEDRQGTSTVIDLLAFDPSNSSAIAGAWNAARENARGARETISTEMWEALNATWHAIPAQRVAAQRMGPHGFLGYRPGAGRPGLSDSPTRR